VEQALLAMPALQRAVLASHGTELNSGERTMPEMLAPRAHAGLLSPQEQGGALAVCTFWKEPPSQTTALRRLTVGPHRL